METEQHYVSFIDKYLVLTDRLIPPTPVRHKPIYICLNCSKPFEDKPRQDLCWICEDLLRGDLG